MAHKFSLSIALALLLPAAVFAADGSIKIKFKLDGEAPKPAKLKIDKDEAVCAPKMPVEESLKVGKEKGIANIAMYMYVAERKAPVSEAALKALAKEVKMDNLDCRYQPRMIAVHTSQTVIFGNPDPMGHNVKGDFFKNGSFNDLIPGGGSTKRPFTKGEVVPMPVSCGIHGWMGGHVLVRDNPYFGVSNEDGELKIPNVPEGKHTFTIWQERAGFVTKSKQQGKDVAWKLGRMEVTVKGDTDLGEFLIPVSVFEKK